ncbi:MAG TPA: hypothetical protein PK867_03480, partial [Pirellulales bacterium]|nr:hypothetical protein [Pirellulales bacterium]
MDSSLTAFSQPRNLETCLIVEKPIWNRRVGDLTWRGTLVLHLSEHATVALELLDEFHRRGWIWVIKDP